MPSNAIMMISPTGATDDSVGHLLMVDDEMMTNVVASSTISLMDNGYKSTEVVHRPSFFVHQDVDNIVHNQSGGRRAHVLAVAQF
jgi:hypothetical protein